MALPELLRRIFANDGAGPLLREDILPGVNYSIGVETWTGNYETDENGVKRKIYKKKIFVATMPNASRLHVPHGISNLYEGVARGKAISKTTRDVQFTVPRPSVTANDYIDLLITNSQRADYPNMLYITVGTDYSKYYGKFTITYTCTDR